MMTRTISACVVLLTLAFAPALQAKAKPQDVVVDCGAGQSLAAALATVADALTIQFVGTCIADVVVQRGNVTIRGADATAAIQGSLRFDRTVPGSDALPDGPVNLENFSISSSAGDGLTVGPDTHVVASHLTITNSASNGANVYGGGFLRCIDCVFDDNGVAGIGVDAAVLELVGNNSASNNGSFGLFVLGGGSSAVVDRSNPLALNSLTTNGNTITGITVSTGGSFNLAEHSTVTANGNGPTSRGAGVQFGTGGSGFLSGETFVDGNGVGVSVIAGRVLAFDNITATNNVAAGLEAVDDGELRLIGASNSVSGSPIGANALGSYLVLANTTFSNNANNDLVLTFGSKARLLNTVPGTKFCDASSLSIPAAACLP